ncbi:septation protein A [Sutterella sp.]|uniref:septation protein A n=1 Tax=Sutterella sp. TaxID=1981025 RepID=UPI0026DFC5C8|nr:septation protein A [Sutterella sp.]MDO5530980.1 septation protein A [Sutterella sp.]
MKLLFDLFPVILFFGAFKGAEHFPDEALSIAAGILGDGVTAATAPVFLATVTAIVATFLQIGWLKLRGRKIEPMLWISLAVIVVFGGLTLWLKNEMFIKWKPTILYWIFCAILSWGSLTGRNFIRMLMKEAIKMPDAAWAKLQWMWIVFFLVVGVINLIVAYTFPTEIWVDFKLFGLLSLTLIFTIGAAVWMTKQSTDGQN